MRNFTTRIFILCLLFCTTHVTVKAQELSFGADLVSNYIWRGSKTADVSFQPEIAFDWAGFTASACGSTDFTGETFELDLSVFYAVGNFSFGITDYYGVYDKEEDYSYFKYRRGNAHTFEATVEYTVSESIPLTFGWNTSLGEKNTEHPIEAYSTYITAAYPFSVLGMDCNAELAMTPWKGAYADECNVVNISLELAKEIPITEKYALPIYTQVIFNPAAEKAFFVFGLTI